MSMKIFAIPSDMYDRARDLTAALNDFKTATTQTKNAADKVTSGWEGDARNAFVAEQDTAIAFYKEMSRLMSEYIKAVKNAAKEYERNDKDCARLLRNT